MVRHTSKSTQSHLSRALFYLEGKGPNRYEIVHLLYVKIKTMSPYHPHSVPRVIWPISRMQNRQFCQVKLQLQNIFSLCSLWAESSMEHISESTGNPCYGVQDSKTIYLHSFKYIFTGQSVLNKTTKHLMIIDTILKIVFCSREVLRNARGILQLAPYKFTAAEGGDPEEVGQPTPSLPWTPTCISATCRVPPLPPDTKRGRGQGCCPHPLSYHSSVK